MRPADRIHALGRFSGAPGLHRIRALCCALGDPQERLKFVHLAGTNGKGSTATMIAQVMQEAGYRTGLYTSPFLVVFNERIRVNGRMIPDEDLNRLFEQVDAAAKTLTLPAGEHIGEFEFVTALAFLYFVEQNCDIVVLETGLGGAFDATNVILPPEAAVITSISLDHTAVLGDTISQIAQTKAGIFKTGSAHISAPGQQDEALDVLRICAPDLTVAPQAELLSGTPAGSRIIWQGQTYTLRLPGRYQVENAATSLTTLQALRDRGWRIPEDCISRGLEHAFIPGRFQIVRTNPTIILDGGHNPDGIRKLSESVKLLPFTGKLRLVIGMCADKSVREAVKEIGFTPDQIYVTPLQNERTIPAEELALILRETCHVIVCCENCADALVRAQKDAAPEDLILVCGSLYLVGEAEKILSARQESAE